MTAAASTIPNATIFYHSDGFDTGRPQLMGRHAAGEGMLNGFARYSGIENFHCLSQTQEMAREFATRVAQAAGKVQSVNWVPFADPRGVKETGCLMLPDPNLPLAAWRRRAGDPSAYSICGVTHTIATEHSIDMLGGMMTAPVEPWDALICTSSAVLTAVEKLIDDQAHYLTSRFGAQRFPLPRLVRIPLGVDAAALTPDAEARAAWRARLGMAEADVGLLFFGRLSFHAKAHPYVMFRAAQRVAATMTTGRLHLILAGWYASDPIAETFREAARRVAPDVQLHELDGRQPDVRTRIWHAADIFLSPVDNIQETFGLTPVEAMAAGLPVLVSDWDGYRDTVREGVDGFRSPTVQPMPGLGGDLIDRLVGGFDNYDQYCANTSVVTAVDIDAFTERLARLVGSADLRRQLGGNGRARVLAEFDWRVVIGQYQTLWAELADIRRLQRTTTPLDPRRPAWPLRTDPFRMFAHYPTVRLTPDVRLRVPADAPGYADVFELGLFRWSGSLQPTAADHQVIVARLAGGPATVGELLVLFPEERRAHLARGLGGLIKMGLLALA